MTKQIAFQGELGANSHIACEAAYPDMKALPCDTFEDAFAAVSEGQAALGMIPIAKTAWRHVGGSAPAAAFHPARSDGNVHAAAVGGTSRRMTEALTISIDGPLAEDVRAAAEARGLSPEEYVRKALAGSIAPSDPEDDPDWEEDLRRLEEPGESIPLAQAFEELRAHVATLRAAKGK
jgi:hypothetical protein